MEQKWINEGGVLFPVGAGVQILKSPGPGIWQVWQSPNPMDKRLGLIKVDDKFVFDYKIYDLGGKEMFDKVKRVWKSKAFVENNRNLGIIYNGIKGTGKTVSAKLLCNDLNLPTIIVNHAYEGLILDFVQSLEFECIIFIDEAEKTFTGDDQQILLKMIDGVYNKSRKLYLLTTNTLSINDNLISRPGRIRYIQEFKNLPESAVEMYVDDNLIDKSKKAKVLEQVDLLEISTIDILKSIVEEVNILGDIDSNTNLNIPRANFVFDILIMRGSDASDIDAVLKFIEEKCPKGADLYDWFEGRLPVDYLDSPAKSKSKKSEDREEPIEQSDPIDEVEQVISGRSAWVGKLVTKWDIFFSGQQTNQGEISKKPGDLKDSRFFTTKSSYDYGEESLCMILRQRGNPSLYGKSKLIL